MPKRAAACAVSPVCEDPRVALLVCRRTIRFGPTSAGPCHGDHHRWKTGRFLASSSANTHEGFLILLCYERRAQQKGQCGSWVRRKREILMRRVAIEAGLCRSARTRRTARLEVKRKLRGA